MNAQLISTLSVEEAQRLYHDYVDIANWYEARHGGPRGNGMPVEYWVIRNTASKLYAHYCQLMQSNLNNSTSVEQDQREHDPVLP